MNEAAPFDAPAHEALIRQLLGPLRPHYDDPEITEIMINGPHALYVEHATGGMRRLGPEARFADDAALRSLARAILQYAGKRLTATDLSLEARLPNKSRVHIVQDPAARGGIAIAIRKFPETRPRLEDMVAGGSLSAEAADALRAAVAGRRNIIVSGGTGTGKTTLLNALAGTIGADERIITIEDVAEIALPEGAHVVSFEVQMPDAKGRGGATIRELFRAALRMRPDRVLVGECRGGEALDMIQAMNSGHAGSLSTVHADDPVRALSRLETLCLMADVDIPLVAVKRQLVEALDLIVQVERVSWTDASGATVRARRVSRISELAPPPDADDATPYRAMLRDLFRRAPGHGPAPLERV